MAMNVWTESLAAQFETYRPIDRKIPGSPGILGIVGLAQFVSSPLTLARKRQAQYGDISRMSFGVRNGIIMLGPDANEFVLMDRERAFSARKAWMAAPMGIYFRNGLLVMDPPDHLKHRRIMQMAFTSESLARHLAIMSPLIEESVENLVGNGKTSKKIKFFPAVKELALRFSAKVFLGEDLGPKTDALNKAFLDTVEASGPLNFFPFLPIPGTLAYSGLKARKLLEAYFYERLPQKRRSETDDFFSLICHAVTPEGERFTDAEIVDHLIFLMMAAHDTSTITSTTMAYHLAKHPEWQARCRAEARAILPTHPTLDDLAGTTETDWAIKEALRLHPPLSVFPRIATKDVDYKGYRIRKGNMVILVPSFTHRMPELWTRPDDFDPERFAPARAEDKKHRFAWVPFGGGAHKCLGMHFGMLEVKTIFLHLLRRYDWTVPKKYQVRYNNVSLGKPWDGLPIMLRRLGQ